LQRSGQSRWTKFQFSELGGHPTSFLHICLSKYELFIYLLMEFSTLELNVHCIRWNSRNFFNNWEKDRTKDKFSLWLFYFYLRVVFHDTQSLVLFIYRRLLESEPGIFCCPDNVIVSCVWRPTDPRVLHCVLGNWVTYQNSHNIPLVCVFAASCYTLSTRKSHGAFGHVTYVSQILGTKH